MELNEAFDEIYKYTHAWNWAPDWEVLRKVYMAFPDAYSVLTPFAYSYLEELIRSTTSEYGRELVNKDGSIKNYRKVGTKLIDLAIEENRISKPEFVKILPRIKFYFSQSSPQILEIIETALLMDISIQDIGISNHLKS